MTNFPSLPAALLSVAVGLAAGQAHAQSGAAFGGVEAGRDRFAYVGASAPIGGADGDWALRGIASVGDYDYESGATTVDGDYRQAEVSVLRTFSGGWGYLNLGVGARVTDTELSPADAGNPRSGVQWDGLITVDGVRRLGSGWDVGGYGAYGVDMREYFIRVEATRAIGQRFRLGAEATAQGDRSYDRQGVGAVAVYAPNTGVAVRGAVGSKGGDAYVSLGLVRSF